MTASTLTLGYIGLGAMGGPMCRNVVMKHDGPVWAFDLNADALAAFSANAAVSIVDIASKSDVIFLSLPGGKQVAAVCGEILAHGKPGTVIIDLSTTSVADARSIAAKLSEGGMAFADAPVARARAAAKAGTLSIMVGASDALFAQIEPLLRYMGSDVTYCGDVGCGQVVKLINNTLLFEHVAALAEMMVVAERAGVVPETLLNAVSIGSGDSFALRNHGIKAMLPRDFPEKAFPSDYVLKDLSYALELAENVGIAPHMAEQAKVYYQASVDKGVSAKYFPAIIELIEESAKP